MRRTRFKANADDYRPVNWPVKHPFWCSGSGDDYSIVVAYADNIAEIKRNWPESRDITHENVSSYVFTDRFEKPDWFIE